MNKGPSIIISAESGAEIELDTNKKGRIDLEVTAGVSADEEYFGPYSVTPSDVEQVMKTAQKIASKDIVVNPIPSNYGKIGWNGSILTVS